VVEANKLGGTRLLSALGKSLPKEPEWGKAARGTDGGPYPWGDASPTSARPHFAAGHHIIGFRCAR
jgi:formylglycine-generating enzyme required for sulfatase activity